MLVTLWATVFCQQNPGTGAHAFRLEQQGAKPSPAAEGSRLTTTNRMQLFTVITGLTHLNRATGAGLWTHSSIPPSLL